MKNFMAQMICFCGTFLFLASAGNTGAQEPTNRDLAKIVYLDSVVVHASQHGFSVEDFISMVRQDTSFYRAFRNLRFASYLMETSMSFRNRKDRVVAEVTSKHRQHFEVPCRWMIEEQYSSKGLKKKRKEKYKYYTAALYDRLFLTWDTVCTSYDLSLSPVMQETRGMEGHVAALKKLIFMPGSHADVPLLANKTEIFSSRMQRFYTYSIRSEQYEGIPVYVFEAGIKPEYEKRRTNRTLVKNLVTYFSKEDFTVLARNYTLAQQGLLYQFDVQMEVLLAKQHAMYHPKLIRYHGDWNIAAKKRETGQFTLKFSEMDLYSPSAEK